MLVGSASINAASPGFVEGHLKIISPKEGKLAGWKRSCDHRRELC
jgi:hypothetical protein